MEHPGTVVDAAPTDRPADSWTPALRRVRLALALAWMLLLGLAIVLGERPSTYDDLRAAVASGDVDEVRVGEGLSPGATGYATVDLHWRDGLLRHHAEVIEARPRSEAPANAAHPVVAGDVADLLVDIEPDLVVDRRASSPPSSDLFGWDLPPLWAGWLVLAVWISTVLALAMSPEPWRATRWAWFWLLLSAPSIGVPAYLLLGGPMPRVPAPGPGARRLTGGWAFLLAVVLGFAW